MRTASCPASMAEPIAVRSTRQFGGVQYPRLACLARVTWEMVYAHAAGSAVFFPWLGPRDDGYGQFNFWHRTRNHLFVPPGPHTRYYRGGEPAPPGGAGAVSGMSSYR